MMKGFDNFGQKLMNRFFRKVDNAYWDLMSGKIGVLNDDVIATLEGEGDSAIVNENVFTDFGCPIPAFAQNTPVGQIKQGDLIFNQKRALGWVIGVPNPTPTKGRATRTFKILKPGGERGEWSPNKVQSLGIELSGAMVLRSLINVLPGGDLGGLQGMLLPLMAMGGNMGMGGDDSDGEGGGMFGDIENMLPFLIFSGGSAFGGTGAAAGGAFGGNMLQMMMQMKMMQAIVGGKSGKNNPFPGIGSRNKTGSHFDS